MKEYSIEELLAISNPCVLFTGNETVLKVEYKELAVRFHPDHNNDPKATEAFQHIYDLYYQALNMIHVGTWEIPGVYEIEDTLGNRYVLQYKKKHPFELGQMFINDNIIGYLIEPQYESRFRNGELRISRFKYRDRDMENEFKRYLPYAKKMFKTSDGKYMAVIEKTPDLLLLKDVLDFYNKKGYPEFWDKHVAWILSRLYNIICYMRHNHIVHNAISPETVFISPEHHSVAILGGWWYSLNKGDKMVSVPASLYNLVPPKVLATKKAHNVTDVEMAKALCRQALGKVKPPAAFNNWLLFSSDVNVYEEFDIWQNKILKTAYGARKFIELKLTAEMLYET
jgi:serine/threonine protein kinase